MTTIKQNLWNGLDADIYLRLCECRNKFSDILPLTQCVYDNRMKQQGCNKEDALIYTLEHLDCNSQCFDLTIDEYHDILEQIRG